MEEEQVSVGAYFSAYFEFFPILEFPGLLVCLEV